MTKREKAAQRRARAEAFAERRAHARQSGADRAVEEEKEKILQGTGRGGAHGYDNAGQTLKRRKKRRLGLFYALFGVLICGVGVVVVALLFFKVETITLSGNTKYSQADLLASAGVTKGDNLFAVDGGKIQRELTQQYPYIESVEIKRRWPDTIQLEVKETQAAIAVQIEGGEEYALLSSGHKVLETGVKAPPSSVCLLVGAQARAPEPGRQAVYTDETDGALLDELLLLLDQYEYPMDRISRVDIADEIDLSVLFENRVLIRIGSEVQLDYKLRFAKYLIDEEIDPKQPGIINAMAASTGKVTFQPRVNLNDVEDQTRVDEADFPPAAERPYVPAEEE